MNRELAVIAGRLRGGDYDGVMIIKNLWQKEDEATYRGDTYEPEMLKSTKRMLLCQARSGLESLTTTMLLTPKEAAAKAELVAPELTGDNAVAAEGCWHVFTRQETLDFVIAVGDTNQIHRTEIPVVPGIFIMERILETLPKNVVKFEVSYRNAVFAGEPLWLDIEGNKVVLRGNGKEYINGTFEVE